MHDMLLIPFPAMTIGDRIRTARIARHMTLQQVADLFGVNRTSVSSWERGLSRPDPERLPALARALGTSVDYLLTGNRSTDATIEPGPDIRGSVPLVSWVQAGHWREVAEFHQVEDAEAWLPCPVRCSSRTFALRVRGASMEPRFQDGDVIFVDPDVAPTSGCFVVVCLDGSGEATFKQLLIEDGTMFLRPFNPEWPGPRIILLPVDATLCGVVIGKWTAV